MRKTLVCMFVLACIVLAVLPAWAGKGMKPNDGPSYTIQKLDDWDGLFVNTAARGINGKSEIVGQVDDPDLGTLAAYWSPGGSLALLANGLSASGVNDLGEIVGAGLIEEGRTIGRYWASHADDKPLALPPLTGDDESAAYAINRDGVMCGYSRRRIYGPDPRVPQDPPIIVLKTESRAVVWRIDDGTVHGPFELPNLLDIDPTADPDNAFSSAVDINDVDGDGLSTVVGGFMGSSANWTDAVSWTIGFDAEGELLAVPSILSIDAAARGVNNGDVVCGRAWALGQATEAVAWADGTSEELDRSKFVFGAWANAVNDNGVIVGTCDYSKNFYSGLRAVVWPSANDSMIILENFLPRKSWFAHLTHASAVNPAGVIVGVGGDGVSTKAFTARPN